MKTSLSIEDIGVFLEKQLGSITDLRQLIEGEESQALSFAQGGRPLVVRINPTITGFQKDKYAFDNFVSEHLPIPRVVQVGWIDPSHAYCVSEKMPGHTFQEADEQAIQQLLEPITNLWQSIGVVDISKTSGFGNFDGSGYGQSKTWSEYLLSILTEYEWAKVERIVDQQLIAELGAELRRLAKLCPESRQLVHGDFGSNNVLVEGDKVTAILDWENALYGDPLYDIAYAYFWRTWLTCMKLSAAYWGKHLNSMPGYHDRIKCYQLRVGLHEIYDNAIDGNTKMVEWAQERCRQILGQA